jgi:hypothetical protein
MCAPGQGRLPTQMLRMHMFDAAQQWGEMSKDAEKSESSPILNANEIQ